MWKAVVNSGAHAGSAVAIKIIDLDQYPDNSIDEIRKEIAIMSTCSHANMISYYTSFTDASEIWLVMPIVDAGSIHDIMKKQYRKGLKDEVALATILREALKGLAYFHESGEIHRDIKAGNLLINREGEVFIGDFGVAAHIKKGQKRKTFVGSPCWMAPEVVEQTGHDWSADIWSLGITALEIAEGEVPYQGMTAMKIILSIMNSQPPTLNKHENWEKTFREFVGMCLQKDPTKRATADALLKSKFIAKAKDAAYLKQHFLDGLENLEKRIDPGILKLGEQFLEKRKSGGKKKKKAKKEAPQWNFGSGDYKKD